MNKFKKPFSNDNTSKGLGIDYQKLIALEYCLNAKKNDYIWIECFGDVATENESIEVKHHFKKHNLSSNSKDVWNTLKNYVTEYQTIIDNDKLILFTTSYIKDDSIFYNWNEKTTNQKHSILKKHIPSKGIKELKKTFFSLKKNELIKILSKFSIDSEQPKIEEKMNELKDHSFFVLIPDDLKSMAIRNTVGYITNRAIENRNKWEININDFRKDMRFELSELTKNKIPFPFTEKNEINPIILEERSYLFINKIKAIGLRERDQAVAVEDYLKSNISTKKLLEITPTIFSSLKNYDDLVERDINDEKNSNSYDLKKEDIGLDIATRKSREIYFNSIKKEPSLIQGVSNIQKYYRNGRIHDIVENENFDWEYKNSDI